jgi:hypothetical protein
METKNGSIVLTRNTNHWGVFSQLNVFLNEQLVEKLSYGAQKTIEVPAGTHVLRVEMHGYGSEILTITMPEGTTTDVEITTVSVGRYMIPCLLAWCCILALGFVYKGFFFAILKLMMSLVLFFFVAMPIWNQKKCFFILD